MAADFPTSIADFLSYTPAAGKAVPFDLLQNVFDEIVAVQTLLGAGSAGSTSYTPTIISSGGGTPTYSVQVGRYRRFLGLIHVTGRITLATFGTLAAGNISIGLPVMSVNTSNLYAAGQIPYWGSLTTAAVNVTAYVPHNSAVMTLGLVTTAVTSQGLLTKADLSGTSDLVFSAIYPVT